MGKTNRLVLRTQKHDLVSSGRQRDVYVDDLIDDKRLSSDWQICISTSVGIFENIHIFTLSDLAYHAVVGDD